MMNAQLFTNQEAALLNADAYLRSTGLDEVISPFHTDFGNHAYMVLELGATVLQELQANADTLQAKRDEKIAKLQAELKVLQAPRVATPPTEKVEVTITPQGFNHRGNPFTPTQGE